MKILNDNCGAELGIRVTCQRCNKQIFRRKLTVDEFEPMPKGWKIQHGYYYHGWWCPDCAKNYTI